MNLFLLPHQDDEVPVFHEIDRLASQKQAVCIVYLTTGQPSAEPSVRRNKESLQVLEQLGVPSNQVHFVGGNLGIPDGQLQKHLGPLHQAIVDLMRDQPIARIFMPAWEGGHHDHDAAHLLGVSLATQWDCVGRSRQFPYYHGEGLKGAMFKTLSPLAQNGPVSGSKIGLAQRIRYLSLIFAYKSQIKTWIGLGPFLFLHYAMRGTQVLQSISRQRVLEKPHTGPMLYERRQFSTFERFQSDTANYLSQSKA